MLSTSSATDVCSPSAQVVVGKVVGARGVRGWLKIISYCSPRENIGNYHQWYLARTDCYLLEAIRRDNKQRLSAKLQGIDSRDAALALYGKTITIAQQAMSTLAANEYYCWQLQGLDVLNLQGKYLGVVRELMETGGNDVLLVQTSQKQRLLIPYILPQVVRSIDLNNKQMIVDWETDDKHA